MNEAIECLPATRVSAEAASKALQTDQPDESNLVSESRVGRQNDASSKVRNNITGKNEENGPEGDELP